MSPKLIATAVTILLSLCAAESAAADVGLTVPQGALTPIPSSTSPSTSTALGGASTMSVFSSATGRFTCNGSSTAYWPIASQANKYAIGECQGGSEFDRTAKSDLQNPYGSYYTYYDGGYFASSQFNGCGWIDNNQDTHGDLTATFSGCANPDRDVSTFAWVIDAPPGGGTTDGQSVQIAAGTTCSEFANVRPFTAGTLTPTGYLNRTLSPGYVGLAWRYIVGAHGVIKYDVYGNSWTMVHDRNLDPGQGNWAFVRTSCLQSPLPPASAATSSRDAALRRPDAPPAAAGTQLLSKSEV